MKFKPFAQLVHEQFKRMSQHELFVVGKDNRAFEAHYLASFPEGSNPIYKTNTEHDCTCCKQFIHNLGNLVANVNGKLVSVWDIEGAVYPYDVVAKSMAEFVKVQPITNLFRTSETKYGAVSTKQLVDGTVINWDHFFGEVAAKHRSSTPDAVTGKYRTDRGVFKRGLEELAPDAIQQVIELIEAKALYRGEEHLAAVKAFGEAQHAWRLLDAVSQDRMIWMAQPGPAITFRNTVIGTLVQDLSEGKVLEAAVASFEAKVAPTNYKRPTALITPRMVDAAVKTLADLGLEQAIERRFANIKDVTVNNVLWVDGSVQPQMKGGIAGLLASATAQPVKDVKGVDISIEDFMKMLPTVKGINLLVRNKHSSNFMSLTAPVHADAGKLFKWDNGFAWSYNGNVADSFMREQVQARGGSVSGVFRFTHSWNRHSRNTSLMDLHVFMPGSTVQEESTMNDNYGNLKRVGWNNRNDYASGGRQDVDYACAAPVGYVPVENITFPTMQGMPDGQYICKVHNWARRAGTEGGFEAEIEFGGEVFQYSHPKALKNKEWVTVAVVTKRNGSFSIRHCLPCGSASAQMWDVTTETFVKVDTLMYSPNYWDDNAVGNKHWLFMLDGCKNDEDTRGVYNEFLRSDLDQHRKVFEVLGNRTKCPVVDDQLSGLGFSSTKNDTVTAQVTTANGTRLFNINF